MSGNLEKSTTRASAVPAISTRPKAAMTGINSLRFLGLTGVARRCPIRRY
jgi:hypothetical protein